MARLLLTPENQIQRLNTILNKVQTLQKLDSVVLVTPSRPKSWSIIEVLTHLNIAYGHYHKKYNEVLPKMPHIKNEQEGFIAGTWQKMVIEMQRPKGNVRKWKMKTMKRFEPMLDQSTLTKDKIGYVFQQFFELHGHLKESILQSRGKDFTKTKIASAIGPVVKFHLPESFEFLLCHLERHMVQIDEILKYREELIPS